MQRLMKHYDEKLNPLRRNLNYINSTNDNSAQQPLFPEITETIIKKHIRFCYSSIGSKNRQSLQFLSEEISDWQMDYRNELSTLRSLKRQLRLEKIEETNILEEELRTRMSYVQQGGEGGQNEQTTPGLLETHFDGDETEGMGPNGEEDETEENQERIDPLEIITEKIERRELNIAKTHNEIKLISNRLRELTLMQEKCLSMSNKIITFN
jgi:hypothetical protein